MKKNMIKPEQWKKVIDAVSSGLTNIDACTVAGIAEDSLYTKIKKDKEFSELLKKAQISFKFSNIQKIKNDGSWQSAAWLLERKFKTEFGREQTIDLTTKGKELQGVIVQVKNVETKKEIEKLSGGN